MAIKDSDQYLADAAAALELAREQTHSPEAMAAHCARGLALMAMYDRVSVREVTGLTPVEPAAPVAVLDCHDRRWDRRPDGRYDMRGAGPVPMHSGIELAEVETAFGPLRPAEQSR